MVDVQTVQLPLTAIICLVAFGCYLWAMRDIVRMEHTREFMADICAMVACLYRKQGAHGLRELSGCIDHCWVSVYRQSDYALLYSDLAAEADMRDKSGAGLVLQEVRRRDALVGELQLHMPCPARRELSSRVVYYRRFPVEDGEARDAESIVVIVQLTNSVAHMRRFGVARQLRG